MIYAIVVIIITLQFFNYTLLHISTLYISTLYPFAFSGMFFYVQMYKCTKEFHRSYSSHQLSFFFTTSPPRGENCFKFQVSCFKVPQLAS